MKPGPPAGGDYPNESAVVRAVAQKVGTGSADTLYGPLAAHRYDCLSARPRRVRDAERSGGSRRTGSEAAHQSEPRRMVVLGRHRHRKPAA